VNILISNSTDIFAGGEDYVLILAKYLKLRGHEVFVSALPGHLLLEKCDAGGIETVPMEYQGMNRVFTVAAMLRKELQKRAVDIIHSNANYDRTCAALAVPWTHIPHVAGVHSTHSIQHNITHWIRNHYGIDHFVTDADAGRDVLITEDGIPPERISTIPIGIENDSPSFRREARKRTRAALGISDDTLVVGNVARLVPFKGQRYLIEAAAEITRRHPNVLFLIIGDGELQHDLQTRAATLNVESSLRFLGFQDHLEQWYPAFDIYCHASLELAAEMFPIAVLRALASALPVVCTRVGGIASMVDEGASGYLVGPEDAHGLAEALGSLVADPARRAALGAASFNLFLQKYHATQMAERVEHVYTTVIASARKRPSADPLP
jgi:glycosyltransferase involved in cell wall biosynthesis